MSAACLPDQHVALLLERQTGWLPRQIRDLEHRSGSRRQPRCAAVLAAALAGAFLAITSCAKHPQSSAGNPSRQFSAPDAPWGTSPGSTKPLEQRERAGLTEPRSEPELSAAYEGQPALSVLTGKATYYANSLAGNRTASGERYDPAAFTAAHRRLRFGSVARVIRVDTGRHVYVRITDRGPFGDGRRVIDLSRAAAERLDMIKAGVVDVRVEVVAGGQ